MKRIIYLFFMLSILNICCNPIQVSALDTYDYNFESGSGFIYRITDDQISITQYACSPEGVNGDIIPDEINDYPVTTIGYRAFHLINMLESITLPETLVTIEDEAFAGCESLKSIVIPRSVEEIGSCALGYDFIAMQISVGSKYSDFTIYGYTDTAAETYAKENSFTFIALDDVTTTTITDTSTETQTTSSTTADVVSSLCGDVNLDGNIDLRDAILLEKYDIGTVELNAQQLANGDCNDDGVVNSADATTLLKFQVQLIDILPFNESWPVSNPEVIDVFTPCTATIDDDFDDWVIMVELKCQYSDPERTWMIEDFPGVENIRMITQHEVTSPYRQYLLLSLSDCSKENVLKLIRNIENLSLAEIKEISTLKHGMGLIP